MKRIFALGALPLFLTACMVGPDYVKPSAPTPVSYQEASEFKAAHPQDDAIRGKWWEIYHDAELNALEEQVNISNQNVLQAEAQFREAAAAVKVARAGLFPTITANPAYTLSQASQNTSGGGGGRGGGTAVVSGNQGSTVVSSDDSSSSTVVSGGSGGAVVSSGGSSQHVGATTVTIYNLPLEATYMADVWGGVRRQVQENSTNAQATFADLENARLSYQATLAQDYFSLRGLDAEARLLEDTVASYQKFVVLTTNRYNAGIASKGDVALAKTQLDTTRAQLIDLGVQRAVYEHAIATLIGTPAPLFTLGKKSLAGSPPKIPVAVPSTLLERRPDIAGAERRVASANAAIGVAVAAYYPTITLNASTGLESVKLTDLFTGPSFLWSVGPVIAQTLFDAGRTHGEVQEARANEEASVAVYRETVLTAFQQVEDDLSGLLILAEEGDVANEAVTSAKQSLDISTNQYKAGTEDYLTVITSQATALNDEVSAVSIRTRRMTTSVLLIEALGGGWDVSKLPGSSGVADVPPAQAQIAKEKK